MKLLHTFCILHIVVAVASVTGRVKSADFSQTVLSHLNQALNRYRNVRIHAHMSQLLLREPETIREQERPSQIEIVRQGNRARLSVKSKFSRGKDVWGMQSDYILYPNGDVLSCQARLDAALRQVQGPDDNLGFLFYSQRLAGTQSENSTSIYNALKDGETLLWLVGYAPIAEYIRDAHDVAITPTDDGARLEADSRQLGKLTLLLSKSHGWLPKSFHVIKQPVHKARRGRVSDIRMAGGGVWPAGGVKRITWAGTIDSFGDAAGQPFAKQIAVVKQVDSEAGPTVTTTTKIDVQQLAFEPALQESDFYTDIVAPVGFPVTVDGADHLPYEWDGKGPVAAVSEVPRFRLETLRGAGGSRLVLIVLNVALILVLALLLWRKYAATP
jgi:hypothetical protein